MKKRIFALFLTALFLLFGCSQKPKDYSGYIVRYDLTALPRTLDPQLAGTGESLMLVENTFEGLLRQGRDGSLEPGVAKTFSVSEDGLRYTFFLREDAFWSSGEDGKAVAPVTAHDFVFALRRVVDPATGSGSASDFLSLRNAKQILAGELPTAELGARAVDDYTLELTLETPNPFFPQVMASAAAMPCNEEFFLQTKGRYGLEPQYLLFNGPFLIQLKSYDPEKRINLRANPQYHSEKPTIAGGVNFYLQTDDPYGEDLDAQARTAEEKVKERFYQGTTDAAPVSYQQAQELEQEKGVQTYSFENIVWGLAFNCNTNTYGTQAIRRAFALVMEPEDFLPYLTGNYAPARAIVPPAVKLLDKPYREIAGSDLLPTRDAALAKQLLAEGLTSLEVDKLSKTSILCPDSSPFPAALSMFQKRLQEDLGLFVNLEPLPIEELTDRVEAGDYMIALLPMEAGRNNPDSVLSNFSKYASRQITGYTNEQLDELLSQARVASDIAQAADLYRQAEELLVQAAVYLPIAYETSYYAADPQVKDLLFSPFSYRVFFKYAYRLEE